MLSSTVLALTVLAGQTWTVSSDGRADFSEIGDAIADARVAVGDILLVNPGEYEGFALDRGLTIVGAAGTQRPRVEDPVAITPARFEGEGFAFGFIEFRASVVVNGVEGASRFDNCVMRADDVLPHGIRVTDCDDVVLSRCNIRGSDADPKGGKNGGGPAAGHGVISNNSHVTFVDSVSRGGFGQVGPGVPPHAGGHGVVAQNGTRILMAGGQMLGSPAGGDPNFLKCNLGQGGDGLRLSDSSVDVRGSGANDDRILPPPPPPCGPQAFSIRALGPNNDIRFGGPVAVRGVQAPPGTVEVTTLLQPYLQNNGPGTPGSNNTLRLRGEPNQFALFFGSNDTTRTEIPDLDLTLGFDPNSLYFIGAVQTPGVALAPANCPYDVPNDAPVLDGMATRFQCVLPNQPAHGNPVLMTGSNAVDFVLRF